MPVDWSDIALGLVAIVLMLAFFAFSDEVGAKDHPPRDRDDE